MAQITTVINVCDRCGSQHNAAEYMSGQVWGQLTIAWQGDTGGRAWDGAAGGVTIKGKGWLCRVCTDEFLKFMDGKKMNPTLHAQIRNDALDEAASVVADHNREGRQWVPGSLWGVITQECSARIEALKSIKDAETIAAQEQNEKNKEEK